jgi:hypothetical protein
VPKRSLVSGSPDPVGDAPKICKSRVVETDVASAPWDT